MKNLFFAALLLLPVSAFAHQTQTYKIAGKDYAIVVGSLNEPAIVGQRSGIDLRVSIVAGTVKTPVLGLEKTLKAEVIVGEKHQELPLTAAYNQPGAYEALFVPTEAATYAYRIFGSIAGEQIDATYECNPKGHEAMAEEHDEDMDMDHDDEIQTATLVSEKGAFGCPLALAGVEIPPRSGAAMAMTNDVGSFVHEQLLSFVAFILSVIAVCFAVVTWERVKKHSH